MSQQEAKNELNKRTARNIIIRRGDYKGFLLYQETIFKHHYKKPLRATWWDSIIAIALMDIFWGVHDRLIIEMPPRHGKTERGVRMFASYGQGLDSIINFQYATYGDDLSTLTSSETKEIMESSTYKELFPNVDFSNKLNTKNHWKLSRGGGFLGTSVGGSSTGMGAEIHICDDLIKAIEASSKTVRDKAWDFYNSSVLTRLEGRKAVIIIMQRLHEDDPVGRALKENGLIADGGAWEKLTFPIVNSFEQFEQFYKWVKSKNIDINKNISDDEIKKIELLCDNDYELAQKEYDELYKPKAYQDFLLKQKYLVKYKKVAFYKFAREIFLEKYPFEADVISYKEHTVTREPLTTLDDGEYGLDFVVNQREQMSLSEFKKQYFQDAEVSESGFFDKNDFTYVADIEIPEQYEYILVDNAESQSASADDRGIVVVGKSELSDGVVKSIVMDGKYGKWDVYGTCENIMNLMIKFPKAQVLIEGAMGGITLGTVLKKEVLVYNNKAQVSSKPLITNSISVFKPTNQVSKNSIIGLMVAPLEQHLLHFYKFVDSAFLEQLMKEFLKFNPEKKHNTDNCIDPLARTFFLPQCTPKPFQKPKVVELKSHHQRRHSIRTWRGI